MKAMTRPKEARAIHAATTPGRNYLAIQLAEPTLLKNLRSISIWISVVIGVFSMVAGLLEVYPWLYIQEGLLLDPKNPYSELFSVSNGGYAPISDLSADCILNLDSEHIVITNSGGHFQHFAAYLSHSGNVTIPCFRTIVTGGMPLASADLTVTITYSFFPLTYQSLRRHQTFKFKAVETSDGSLRWTFAS